MCILVLVTQDTTIVSLYEQLHRDLFSNLLEGGHKVEYLCRWNSSGDFHGHSLTNVNLLCAMSSL